jgi:hypothetical protein
VAHALVGMATAVGEWWMDEGSMSREHLVEYLTELLWGGFSGITQASTPPDPRAQARSRKFHSGIAQKKEGAPMTTSTNDTGPVGPGEDTGQYLVRLFEDGFNNEETWRIESW